MGYQHYPEEFKIEAVKQVTEKGNLSPMHPSASLALWLFVSDAPGIGQMMDVGRKTLYIRFNKFVRVYVVATCETTLHRLPRVGKNLV